MIPKHVQALVLEVQRAIETATWEQTPAPELEARGASAFSGRSDAWSLLVVPGEGRRPAIGTATRRFQVVYLTPELAERAAALAQRKP